MRALWKDFCVSLNLKMLFAAKSCIYRLKQAYIIWMSKKSAKIDKFFSVFWPNTDLVSQEWAFMKDNFIRNKCRPSWQNPRNIVLGPKTTVFN